MKFREALGEILRQIRREQGKTLEFIAENANISVSYLSEIERGKKEVSSELIFAICSALQVPMWMLVYQVSSRLYSSREQTPFGKSPHITSRSEISPESIHKLRPVGPTADHELLLYAA